MPIHFRCHSCDRMLSIARRKAGTQVGCPKCGKLISVPAAAGVAIESNPIAASPKLEAMPLFERTDFEQLLNPALKAAVKTAPPRAMSEPHPVLVPTPVSLEESGVADVVEIDGIVVTRSRMTVIAVVVAVLLALAFAAGYFLAAATAGRK